MEEAFGSFLSFIYIWAYLIMTRPASNAIKVLTFAIYVLKPAFPDCEVPKIAVLLMAYALLCMYYLQCLYILQTIETQQNLYVVFAILAYLPFDDVEKVCFVTRMVIFVFCNYVPVGLMFLNIVDIKTAARGQGVFSGICIAALVAISITGFVYLGQGDQ